MCNCVHGVLLGATQASCLCVIKKILLAAGSFYYYSPLYLITTLAKYIKVYYEIFSSSELLNS